ncbi:MAG: hypothetical protein K2W82_09595 [Candidatus Obscuribacterales bacterium]|nr:hypothetical protein [Candidatus Obscuribacterales bacterium]
MFLKKFLTLSVLLALCVPTAISAEESVVSEPAQKPVANSVKTSPEVSKGQIEHAAQKQEQVDKAMIEGVNQVDGVEVDPKLFEQEKKGFSIGDLNPIKWIFKPVIDMQKQIVHLQKQIMRLEAPIASLQKPMVGLRQDMVGVSNQMEVMHGDINNIHGGMTSVDKRLSHVEQQLDKIYTPVAELKNPVIQLQKPVTGVGNQLTTLKKDLKELKDVVSLTTTLILIAVIAVGFLIVVGTPVAALFAWRHRRTIMEKLGEDTSGKAEPLAETESDKNKVRPIKKLASNE